MATLLDPVYKDCAFLNDSSVTLGKQFLLDAFRMIMRIDELMRTSRV